MVPVRVPLTLSHIYFPLSIVPSQKWTQVSLHQNHFFARSYEGTELDTRKVLFTHSMCHTYLTLYLNSPCLICFSSEALSPLPTDLVILITRRSEPCTQIMQGTVTHVFKQQDKKLFGRLWFIRK